KMPMQASSSKASSRTYARPASARSVKFSMPSRRSRRVVASRKPGVSPKCCVAGPRLGQTRARRANMQPVLKSDSQGSLLPTDSRLAARIAGLQYVQPDRVGISRRRAGSGFTYIDASGKRIRNPRELERIRLLVIPPAWTDVWICPVSQGHLQAVGRDAKG